MKSLNTTKQDVTKRLISKSLTNLNYIKTGVRTNLAGNPLQEPNFGIMYNALDHRR